MDESQDSSVSSIPERRRRKMRREGVVRRKWAASSANKMAAVSVPASKSNRGEVRKSRTNPYGRSTFSTWWTVALYLVIILALVGLGIGLGYFFSTLGSDDDCDNECYDNDQDHHPPHIIYILADDLGFNDISWTNPEVETPHLDALARDGVILDSNYALPVCSPSRSALMTGKYPFHTGMQHDIIRPGAPHCLDLNLKLLPQYLKDEGYATHLLGKWHLGYCKWECTPTYRGFDTFYGFYHGHVDWYSKVIDGGYDWRDNEDEDWSAAGTYATHLIRDRTLEIIHNHDPDTPLFILMSHGAPHTPIQVPPNVEADPAYTFEGNRRNYLAMVTDMDDAIGQVVAALQETGLYENSVIIFNSDNGGQLGPSSNYPLRGEKASSFEGGTRVPAMVHSPLMYDRGRVASGLFHMTDWVPTIVSLTGSSADLSELDGVDQSRMLMEGEPSSRSEVVYNIDQYSPYSFGAGAIRMGDYKLIVGFPGMFDGWEQYTGSLYGTGYTHELDLLTGFNPSNTSTVDPWAASQYNYDWVSIAIYANMVRNNVMLFNLRDDPEEKMNLAELHPDLVAMMRERLDELTLQAVELDLDAFVPVDESSPDFSNGVWSPLDYCHFDK